MSELNSSSIPATKIPGIYAIADQAHKEAKKLHSLIFGSSVKSKRQWEEIREITGIGMAGRHTQGGDIAISAPKQGYQEKVYLLSYSLGIVVTFEEIEQNLYMDKMRSYAAMIARAHNSRREKEAADVAFNLAGSLNRGDGVPLLSASHPTPAAGTQSNVISAQLSEAALELAAIQIRRAKDATGLQIDLQIKDLHVSPDLLPFAKKLKGTANEVGTANNTINVIKNDIKNVYDNPYIENSDFWAYTTNIASTKEGFIHFDQVSSKKGVVNLPGKLDTLYTEAAIYAFMIGNHRSMYGYAGTAV